MRIQRLAIFGLATILAISMGAILLTQNWTVTAAEEYGIRFQRTALIADGKTVEAQAFAREVVSYLNANHPGANLHVYMETFGQMGRIHWFADHKDLAALEQRSKKMAADQKWQQLLATATGLFVEGASKDTLYTLIQ